MADSVKHTCRFIYFKKADTTDEPPETVYLHTKTYDGFGYTLLADNKRNRLIDRFGSILAATGDMYTESHGGCKC